MLSADTEHVYRNSSSVAAATTDAGTYGWVLLQLDALFAGWQVYRGLVRCSTDRLFVSVR